MIQRLMSRSSRQAPSLLSRFHLTRRSKCRPSVTQSHQPAGSRARQLLSLSNFHTGYPRRAQGPSADVLMEHLNELYATAKDEFEIAAEETEKKTVYAADDREGAQEALQLLKESYQKATTESDPEVAKEVQGRVGQRIRELENALTALEESAMED